MAAFFGGAAKAPIGALLMISEMTTGYGLLVSLMLACTVAVILVPKKVSNYEEQIEGSVNSPAHFGESLRRIQQVLQQQRQTGQIPMGEEAARQLTRMLASAPQPGEVSALSPVGQATFLDVKIPPGSPAADKYVLDLHLDEEVLIVGDHLSSSSPAPERRSTC